MPTNSLRLQHPLEADVRPSRIAGLGDRVEPRQARDGVPERFELKPRIQRDEIGGAALVAEAVVAAKFGDRRRLLFVYVTPPINLFNVRRISFKLKLDDNP